MNALQSDPCECGSGLRGVRCCSLSPTDIPRPEASRHLIPLAQRAVQLYQAGEFLAATGLCCDVLELAPDQATALSVLYEIRTRQGNARAAEALLRRSIAFDPNNLAATNNLALLLLGKGAVAEAEVHARNAVRIAPENPQAHNLMGMILTEANRPDVGEYHYRRVLELTTGRDPVLLANLAWNLTTQGRVAEARVLYHELLTAAPNVRQSLVGLARLEEADRNFEAAQRLLDEVEKRYAHDPALRLARAVLLGRQQKYDDALSLIAPIAGSEAPLGPNELLEKGRLLDQLQRYDDAWTAFAEGKRLAREISGISYMDDAAGEQISRLQRFFVTGRLRLLPRADARTDVAQPIFILGFPRSGTTLIEQMLSAHPRIAAGDELPLINEITGIMPRLFASPLAYPEALAELWMGDQRSGLNYLRDHYLRRVAEMGIPGPGVAHFTDKMPLNETHLGLIALLFPRAPLIHVLRNPLDVMVSAFSNAFTHGFHCAADLQTAARHYIRIADLVRHYRSEMVLRYLPVHYEDVVSRPQDAVRTILDFIGEPFEPACLAPHENRRYARTASYAQVTQPLYSHSINRWMHYRRHLSPVIPTLQPIAEQLGYSFA